MDVRYDELMARNDAYEKLQVNMFLQFSYGGFNVELSYELQMKFHFASANVEPWILNFCFSVICQPVCV